MTTRLKISDLQGFVIADSKLLSYIQSNNRSPIIKIAFIDPADGDARSILTRITSYLDSICRVQQHTQAIIGSQVIGGIMDSQSEVLALFTLCGDIVDPDAVRLSCFLVKDESEEWLLSFTFALIMVSAGNKNRLIISTNLDDKLLSVCVRNSSPIIIQRCGFDNQSKGIILKTNTAYDPFSVMMTRTTYAPSIAEFPILTSFARDSQYYLSINNSAFLEALGDDIEKGNEYILTGWNQINDIPHLFIEWGII